MALNLTLRKSEEKIERVVKESFSILPTVPIEQARLERETTYKTEYDGSPHSYTGLYKLKGEGVMKHGCHFAPVLVKEDFFKSLGRDSPFLDWGTSIYFNGKGIGKGGYIKEGGECGDWKLIWQSTKYQVVLDQEYNPIPYVQLFDYHNTPFSDQYVNINHDFIDFLKNHPWVVNKDDIKVLKGGNNTPVREYVNVAIKPDAESYREIWNSFDPCRRRSTQYLREVTCGFRTVRDRESKDWFGILPYLLK